MREYRLAIAVVIVGLLALVSAPAWVGHLPQADASPAYEVGQ